MKMRRIAAFALMLMFAAFLTACGGDSSDNTPVKKIEGTVKDNISDGGFVNKADKSVSASETAAAQTGAAYDGFVFTYDGVKVCLDEDSTKTIAALGEYTSYFESVSCAFNGIDKLYSYPHFEIDTYPAGDGVDRVSMIILFDDMCETEEGITIGSSRESVVAAYGIEDDGKNILYAQKGTTSIKFIFDDANKVNYIQYTSGALDVNQVPQN